VIASRRKNSSVALVMTLVAVLGASGCDGGGDSSTIGGTQSNDPVIQDFPLVYIKRPVLFEDDGGVPGDLVTINVREPIAFYPGAQLLMRDRASPSAPESSLTEGIFPDDEDGNPPLYDVKDISASPDGLRLVFALRAPEDPSLDDDEQPTWNIWLFDRETLEVRRVIESDIAAESGQDVAPAFLPDGRIVFSSTRQRQAKAVLLDEGKPQFSAFDEDRDDEALALHVMDDDGTDIQQITFNQSSDLDPQVLGDGRIVFSRWDNVANNNRISLYSANPDGTELQLLYGVHSHDTGPDGDAVEFVEAVELPDGRLLVLLRPPGDQSRLGAFPVAIDVSSYTDHDQPTFDNSGLLADAQEALIPGDLNLDEDTPALQGRYAAFAPLFDGTSRILVAWSPCRLVDDVTDPLAPVFAPCSDDNLLDPNFVEADPLYGVWMFDLLQSTQLPIVVAQEGEIYTQVLVMEPKVNPPVILDKVAGIDLDPDLVGESVGVLHIRSVYDFDGTATVDIPALADPALTTNAERPARFARLVKAVSMPDDDMVDLDNTAFGRSQAQLMRDVLGYTPIHPDGSLKVKVPANVAFWVDILDEQGRRIFPRHQNWLQLRPGEEAECSGCHTRQSELPHGRLSAQAPSANPGAPLDGVPFPNTDPTLFANAGESMAEVFSRINGVQAPSVDISYTDVWTDPATGIPEVGFDYSYRDLDPTVTPPVDPGCADNWTALCRITINYAEHIHPIWAVDRQVFDENDDTLLVRDNTCTVCHNVVDAMGVQMVPAAQLDLSDGPSADEPDHLKSYRELLFNDNRQVVDENGIVIDELVQATDGNGNPLFLLDAEGELVLDIDGNPIPILVNIGVQPSLNVGGANFSPAFFNRFTVSGSHDGRLSAAELKLISEWIDIGGQYYNNPFDVPQ
jgi:hypothetical protein